ncbi:MAG: YicC family protein [Alphaproteobacteria bacterium]
MTHNLQSMTGYARDEASHGTESWVIELRSVNGKSLDLRHRMPGGFDWLETEARKRLQTRVGRGSFNLHVSVKREHGEVQPVLNAAMATALLQQCRQFCMNAGLPEPTLSDLMSVRGVIEMMEGQEAADDAAEAARRDAFLASLDRVLDAIVSHREAEGAAMLAVLSGQLKRIAELTDQARSIAETAPETLRNRVSQRLEEVTKGDPSLPEERIAQEVALLITRADITEEIDRLAAHVDSVNALLNDPDGPSIGRKRDFMAQEFNREANTICSKAHDKALTDIGVELKTVIDQFREQVQNIQ